MEGFFIRFSIMRAERRRSVALNSLLPPIYPLDSYKASESIKSLSLPQQV